MLSCSHHKCGSYSGYLVNQLELLHHCKITGMAAGWRIQHVQLQCREGSRPAAHDRPYTSQERGCLGSGKRIKKVNTTVLELVCLVTEQGQQQIFSFQAGQPASRAGPAGIKSVHQSMYQYVLACTPLKHSCTVKYKYVLVCTGMYRVVPSCTVMYREFLY